jgi:Transcriptional regulatory protein, C terminal
VASKNDLIAHVWKGRIVSESTLTSRIAAARQAIGDSGEDQRLIRTILRKGIRFVGEVRESQNAPSAGTTSAVPAEVAPSLPVPLPGRPSVAVLPFEALTGDAELESFADGLTEDIITGLSRIKARKSHFTTTTYAWRSRRYSN